MRVLICIASVVLVVLQSVSAESIQGVAVDYLKGEGNVRGIRLAYRPYYSHLAVLGPLLEMEMYLEASANLWRYGQPARHDSNYALALSPVFSGHLTTVAGMPVRWEGGIGVSILKDREFAGKHMGSYFQFEDRVGVQLVLEPEKQSTISLRYMHYSNGGLSRQNPGIDFINLSYAVRF